MPRILVVDDEKSMRITLGEFLDNEGYITHLASNAAQAYEALAQNEYDVVISDIIMPHMSGIELLSKIRERSKTVQVIIMTGEPTVDTAVEAVRLGANDYLSKPINKETLLKAVFNAVLIKSLTDEKLKLEKQNMNYQKNLESMIEKRTKNLIRAMQSIVFLLSAVVEIRDPYTAGHQKRVGNLSAAIAQKMNLDSSTVNMLRLVGYIHDIGKSNVPSEILVKPGKLSQLEMALIKEHPTQGFNILSMVDLPCQISEIIKNHHERCNGSGYPNGLMACDISEEAHIVIVADVVEAMMSHRPYRPALGLDVALSEIKNNSGMLYRSDVVNACVDLFLKDNYQIDNIQHEITFPLNIGEFV